MNRRAKLSGTGLFERYYYSQTLLESIKPPALAEDFDTGRIGFVLNRGADVRKIAVVLDATDYVLKEAARLDANLLITHHTLIFDLVNIISKRLSDTLKSAIDNDISIYTMHMNFDKAEGGVNDVLAELLELINITNLSLERLGEINNISHPPDIFSPVKVSPQGVHLPA